MKKPGEILKEFRDKEKLSGEKFGNILGCTQQQVSRMEKGIREITEATLGLLKNYMEEKEFEELKEAIDFYKAPESIRNKIKELENEKAERNIIPFLSSVNASAGYGAINTEVEEEYYEVPYKYAKKGNIAIKIKGDSMLPLFEDKDIIIVNTNKKELENKKFFVVNYRGELFIKKIVFNGEKIFLVSLNNQYTPIKIQYPDEFIVIGKVIFSCREY